MAQEKSSAQARGEAFSKERNVLKKATSKRRDTQRPPKGFVAVNPQRPPKGFVAVNPTRKIPAATAETRLWKDAKKATSKRVSK